MSKHLFKDVFISYGRRESLGFVARMHQQLLLKGYTAWFDKVNIPDGDDYALRINHGIESADNFIFVMAPRSLCSPYCLIELEYARVLGKRVIPINQAVIFETTPKAISAGDQAVLNGFYASQGIENPNLKTTQDVLNRSLAVIGRTDWLDAKEEMQDADCDALSSWAATYENLWKNHEDSEKLQSIEIPVFGKQIDDFEAVLQSIYTVLENQKKHIRQHTELLDLAFQWQRNQKQTKYLLVGKERKAAEDWLTHTFSPGVLPPCEPSRLHCDFICEARKNAENLMTDCFILVKRKTICVLSVMKK